MSEYEMDDPLVIIKKYHNTVRYIAIMVTINVIIAILERL